MQPLQIIMQPFNRTVVPYIYISHIALQVDIVVSEFNAHKLPQIEKEYQVLLSQLVRRIYM